MSTNQQRREAAKRKLERQQERRGQLEQRRKRVAAITAVVVVVAVVGATVALAALDGSSTPSENNAASAAAPSTPLAEPSTQAVPPLPPGACRYTPTPAEPAARPVQVPANLTPAKQGTVAVSMTTSQGVLPITLDRSKAPCTVESFVNLGTAGFYNNTPCHRLVTEGSLKVLQCGDPTGTGSGGPGYTIPDEPPAGLAASSGGASVYPRGVLAMAKTAAPDSGGSQFFLVYADSQLPPEYTIFGTVAEPGIKVLETIAGAGDDGAFAAEAGGGHPNLSTTIQSVTVAAS